MKEILETIRGVISGEEGAPQQPVADNDDVLELTEMVEEDGSITTLKPEATKLPITAEGTAPVTTSPAAPADVLANIDNALDAAAADLSSSAPLEKPVTDIPKLEPTAIPSSNIHPSENDPVSSSATKEPSIPVGTPTNSMPEFHEQETSEEHTAKKQRLISDSTAKASAAALATLMHNLPKHRVDGPSFQSGLTLEALVVEALKPELSTWLDKNLPALVTQLVEKEIKKILPQPEE